MASNINIDVTSLKSHTEDEILAAHVDGQAVWELDTDTAGEDDVLFGGRADVLADVLTHHEFDELPEGWELRPLNEAARDDN